MPRAASKRMSFGRPPAISRRSRASSASPIIQGARWVVVETGSTGSSEFVLRLEAQDERALVEEIAQILLTRTANSMATAQVFDVDPDSSEFDGREPIGSLGRDRAQEVLPRIRPANHWELPKLAAAELECRRQAKDIRDSRRRARCISEARKVLDVFLARQAAAPLLTGTTQFLEIVQREPVGYHPVPLGKTVWVRAAEIEAFEREVAFQGRAATLHRETYVGPIVTATMLWNAYGDEDAQRLIWIAAGIHDLKSHPYGSPVPSAFESAIYVLLRQYEWWDRWHHMSTALPASERSDDRVWSHSEPWSEDKFAKMLVAEVIPARAQWIAVRIYQTRTGLRVVE